MRKTPLGPLLACAFVLVAAAPAAAQSSSSRPYTGVFGGASDTTVRHTLNVNLTVAEAYDDDVYADLRIGIDPSQPQASGFSTMMLTGTDYSFRTRRVQLGATATSAVRHYSELGQLQNVSETAGLGVAMQFARRTSLFANQTVSYSPSYLYGLFPTLGEMALGEVPSAAPDHSAYDNESFAYWTTASMSHGLTRRGRLTAGIDYRFTDYQREFFFRRDLKSFGAQAGYSRSLSRHSTVSLGYRFRNSDYYFSLGGRKTKEHGVDVRMDYTRPLSATRRATFGFSAGSALIDTPLAIDPLGAFEQQYRFLGDAHAGYQFSRSWQVAGSYSRTFEYVPGLRDPVFADGFSAGLQGLLSRRWEMSASTGFSDGESVQDTESAYSTYRVEARLRYAMTRNWAMYGEYLYYYYNFRNSTQLPPGVPPMLERNGVRLGLTLNAAIRKK